MKKSNRGGKRKGAGRKPLADKKAPITVYVRMSTIKYLGGKRGTTSLILERINQADRRDVDMLINKV